MAYWLDLPKELNLIYNFPHLSASEVLVDDSVVVPLDEIQFDECMNYIESIVAILDRKTKTLQHKAMGLVKVQWQHQKGSEYTWEPDEEVREQYLELFAIEDFEDEVWFKWERVVKHVLGMS